MLTRLWCIQEFLYVLLFSMCLLHVGVNNCSCSAFFNVYDLCGCNRNKLVAHSVCNCNTEAITVLEGGSLEGLNGNKSGCRRP